MKSHHEFRSRKVTFKKASLSESALVYNTSTTTISHQPIKGNQEENKAQQYYFKRKRSALFNSKIINYIKGIRHFKKIHLNLKLTYNRTDILDSFEGYTPTTITIITI